MQISNQLKRRMGHLAFAVFRTAFLIGMAYVLLFPLFVMITRAIRPYSDMYNPSVVWIPSGITFENFKYALSALGGAESFLKTIKIVLITTLLTMISCSMAGYGLARFKIKTSGLLVAFAAITVMVPIQTYVIPLFFEFR